MKNVLMIAYYFPPIGGAGTQRSSKFVKYLPKSGWSPTVIAGFDSSFPQDCTLLDDIPDQVKVHRFPLPITVWRRIRNWMFANRFGPIGYGRIATKIGWFLDFPDTKREWADTAVVLANELSRLVNFDVIYTTLPPYSSATALIPIKQTLGLPWVVDFRDHWSVNEVIYGGLPKWLRRRYRIAEKSVVTHADGIVCATEGIADFLKTSYGVSAEKCVVITNGYDREDFVSSRKLLGYKHFVTLTHTGTFYGSYSPVSLFNALKHVWEGPPDSVEHLRIRFIGGMGDVVPEHYAGVSIEVTDRVSHPEAVAAQQNSDLVLLTFDRKVGESTLTGKLFEYLACGTPIFAVIPTGERAEAANIINKCNAGWVADCDRPAEVVEKLTEAIAIVAQHDFRFSPNFTQIAQYSRERLTGLLASFFNKLVD